MHRNVLGLQRNGGFHELALIPQCILTAVVHNMIPDEIVKIGIGLD